MGKTRNKNGSELHYLRGRVKELEKQLRQVKKREHFFEEAILNEEAVEIEEIEPDADLICSHCGKGKLKHFDLLGRIFEECDTCDHRKKIK